jgi:hypothetical protein
VDFQAQRLAATVLFATLGEHVMPSETTAAQAFLWKLQQPEVAVSFIPEWSP